MRLAALHGKILRRLQSAQDTASFSYPEDGVPYDVLLILRGCTGCPYLYEEIEAAHRVVVAAADEIPQAIDRIRSFTSQA